MEFRIIEGVEIDIPKTRKILNERGFRFRTYKDDPRRFSVMLMRRGHSMYRNDIEAMFAMAIVIVVDGKRQEARLVQSIHGKL